MYIYFCKYLYTDTWMTFGRTPAASRNVHLPHTATCHQQPDVNYVQVLEKVEFPCTVHAQRVPFKGNQLRAETR